MYTYLNQKYGLRSLTVNYAQSIIQGVKKFATQDFEPFLFGKLLRSQIPDFYVLLSNELKEHLTGIILNSPNGEKIIKGDMSVDYALLQKLYEETRLYLIIDDKFLDVDRVTQVITENQNQLVAKRQLLI